MENTKQRYGKRFIVLNMFLCAGNIGKINYTSSETKMCSDQSKERALSGEAARRETRETRAAAREEKREFNWIRLIIF